MTFPHKDNYQIYGGDLQDLAPSKLFHQAGATDLPAEDFNQCRATLAAATNVSFQCYIKYSTVTGSMLQYETAWDKVKSNIPTFDEVDTGNYQVNFPATVIDLRGNKQIINFLGVAGNADIANTSQGGLIIAQRVSNNAVIFYARDNGQPAEDIDNIDMFFF